jgi:hypothetical protein
MRRIRWLVLGALASILATSLPAGVRAGSHPRFLTLPFPRTYRMAIWAGWWRDDGELHSGIDYVKGHPDRPWTWERFPVLAAAGGWACAASERSDACIEGVGARVVIRHRRDGRTWYTYYGHLATRTISDRIPLDRDRFSVWVKRGEYLGMAGRTGLPGTGIHVHLQLYTIPFRSWDPYDLYAKARRYPDPAGTNGRTCGPDRFWIDCPPRPPETVSATGHATTGPDVQPGEPDRRPGVRAMSRDLPTPVRLPRRRDRRRAPPDAARHQTPRPRGTERRRMP